MTVLDSQYPIKKLSLSDKIYPKLLKKIKNPPKTLYYRGYLQEKDNFFAIVGTRTASLYGKEVTLKIANALCETDLTIVSGFALGIDTFAHQTVVERKKRTIAVLGTGLDEESLYPRSNLGLAEKILKNKGCLISEYPPGTKGSKFTFPQRNRIIAGMCLGVIVIEAKEKSGALITAAFAKKQRKEVFAVPGPINSLNSKGPNKLIKEGAVLTENADDILKALKIHSIKKVDYSIPVGENPKENLILKTLSNGSLYLDEIIKKTSLSPSEVAGLLAILEIKGKVIDLGGNNYAINSS